MKKIFLILSLLILPFTINAQGFKGYIDIYAGTTFGRGSSFNTSGTSASSNIKTDLTFGLNVTEGYQITSFLFAGIGFGGYTTLTGYTIPIENDRERVFNSFYFPIYADARWNLNIASPITPFVDLKLGYQFGFKISNGELYDWYNYESTIYERHKNGVYFQPSVGVRFGKAAGFNLGIAYNAAIGRKFMKRTVENDKNVFTEIGSSSQGAFLITFGADF